MSPTHSTSKHSPLDSPLGQSTEHYFDCFTPVHFTPEGVRCIDQRVLPVDECYLTFATWSEVAQCIKDMVVRGAPAIGITAAYGIALAARALRSAHPDATLSEISEAMNEARLGLSQTRPTAVNLFWALARMERCWSGLEKLLTELSESEQTTNQLSLTQLLVARCDQEALAIHQEDVAMCRAMGAHGASLLSTQAQILTHCNTGALATGGHGTALGVIRSAWAAGKVSMVYADETRPFLQGARLTAWELHRDQIPVEVVCEGMAAHLMNQGRVDAVFVGADRIAANGDAANKIGTYGLAIIAQAHRVPFYVVAPTSTVDLQTATGAEIPIEQRSAAEVTHCGGRRVVPEGVNVHNPAFDVTPASYITAIITERGVISRGDYARELQRHVRESRSR